MSGLLTKDNYRLGGTGLSNEREPLVTLSVGERTLGRNGHGFVSRDMLTPLPVLIYHQYENFSLHSSFFCDFLLCM